MCMGPIIVCKCWNFAGGVYDVFGLNPIWNWVFTSSISLFACRSQQWGLPIGEHCVDYSLKTRSCKCSSASEVTTLWRYTNLFIIIIIIIEKLKAQRTGPSWKRGIVSHAFGRWRRTTRFNLSLYSKQMTKPNGAEKAEIHYRASLCIAAHQTHSHRTTTITHQFASVYPNHLIDQPQFFSGRISPL